MNDEVFIDVKGISWINVRSIFIKDIILGL